MTVISGLTIVAFHRAVEKSKPDFWCRSALIHLPTRQFVAGTAIEGKPERSLMGSIFKWWFIIFNVIMVLWIISIMSATDEAVDESEDELDEDINKAAGGLAMGLVCGVWFVGAVIFGMLAMVTKPSGTVIVTKTEASSSEDPMAKLAKAKQLLDSGVITEDEFAEMKKKYL